MRAALFWCTLAMLLTSIMAAALCFSSYLVSRKRSMLYAFSGFLFYFFDVALVFKDDFFLEAQAAGLSTVYFVGSPVASVLFGAGTFGSFWLLTADSFEERRKPLRYAPLALFVVGSFLAEALVPAGRTNVLAFYSMRSALLFWTLGYALVRLLTARDDPVRARLSRYVPLGAATFVLGAAVLAENVLFLAVVDVDALSGTVGWFLPQRNFAENLLLLSWEAYAAVAAYRVLSLRFTQPPAGTDEKAAARIEDGLALYRALYGLSPRETDVLRFVLDDLDNQNIASALNLSPSTVKVHVHNILKKTGLENRRQVIQDFWKRA